MNMARTKKRSLGHREVLTAVATVDKKKKPKVEWRETIEKGCVVLFGRDSAMKLCEDWIMRDEAEKKLAERNEALQQVYNALGPKPAQCGCDGCQAETQMALDAVRPFVDTTVYPVHAKKRKKV
jgi:hypothetical protein